MRVVVVGAGICGLTAARHLATHGHDVVVVDKDVAPGGRLASRRIGSATFDVGAQFCTVRSEPFGAQVAEWQRRGLVGVWNHGFVDDGHPRFVGVPAMSALAADLARDLRVECDTMAFAVRPARRAAPHRWRVVIDDGSERPADAVIVTCPLPQAFALLVDAGVELDETLFRTDYDRTIAVLAVLDRPVELAATGGVQDADDVFSFIGDNTHKGVSAVPALTFHARPAWSDDHWSDENAAALLEEAAQAWLDGAVVVDRQSKRWRFATPRTIHPAPCWATADVTIIVAGDAFAGPRVEGAYNSGLAAAASIDAGR